MVRNSLVGLDVELGEQTLEILDRADFNVRVALWILRGDEEGWRLLLATPVYDRLGPAEATKRLMAALVKADYDWVHSPIQLTGTRTPLIRALRQTFGKAQSTDGIRLGSQTIADTWIEDGYVYRIR